jgi:hypothetical protein
LIRKRQVATPAYIPTIWKRKRFFPPHLSNNFAVDFFGPSPPNL